MRNVLRGTATTHCTLLTNAGTHFCGSLDRQGEQRRLAQPGRKVCTGGGRIPLKEWIDAILTTGFDD